MLEIHDNLLYEKEYYHIPGKSLSLKKYVIYLRRSLIFMRIKRLKTFSYLFLQQYNQNLSYASKDRAL